MNYRLVVKGLTAVTMIVLVCACSKQTPTSGGQPNMGNASPEVTLVAPPQAAPEQAEALPEPANQEKELEPVNVPVPPTQEAKVVQPVSVPSPTAPGTQTHVAPTVTPTKTTETARKEPIVVTPKQETQAAPVPVTSSITQPSEPPERAVMAYKNGVELYHAGLMEEAINMFSTAIQLHPNYPEALHDRGLIYFYTSDFDRALTDINAALRIKPNHADYLYSRGGAYLGKGDFDRAIADWEAVLRMEPDHEVKDVLELARRQRGY